MRDDATVRAATPKDAAQLLDLVRRFTTSFKTDPTAFHRSLPGLIQDPRAALLVAEIDGQVRGYLLGFEHTTFYANGPVGWVEEIMVDDSLRRAGLGRCLMAAFEAWSRSHGCQLVALATRRAAPFYKALGYEESATYFRHIL